MKRKSAPEEMFVLALCPDTLRSIADSGQAYVVMPSQGRMIADAIEMADTNAIAYIDAACPWKADDWRDASGADPIGAPGLEQAVRYLEERGFIERHPERSGWIRAKPE